MDDFNEYLREKFLTAYWDNIPLVYKNLDRTKVEFLCQEFIPEMVEDVIQCNDEEWLKALSEIKTKTTYRIVDDYEQTEAEATYEKVNQVFGSFRELVNTSFERSGSNLWETKMVEIRDNKWVKEVKYEYYENYRYLWVEGLIKKYYIVARGVYDLPRTLTPIYKDLNQNNDLLLFNNKPEAREYLKRDEWSKIVEYKILPKYIKV
jgi:hypothetical protein